MPSQKIVYEEILNTELINKEKQSESGKSVIKNLISIVIPLYNEEKTIKRVLEKIPNHGKCEILLINDGSTDNSLKEAKKVNRKDLRIINHTKNRGYGASILTGFSKAKGDVIVTLDSDGQHDPREIPKLIEPILCNEADIIIGSRYLGACYYYVPFYTRVGEFFIKLILKYIFGLNIGNNQSGFRGFKRNTLKYFSKLRNKGMGLTTELLFRSGLKKLRVKEVPITVFPRKFGFSYVKLFKILISIFGCFLHYIIKKIFRVKDNPLLKPPRPKGRGFPRVH